MAPNPTIIKAVEQLGYRVTVGDVAAKAGLNINLAERGLLALASDAGGHLQVAESGEIAYLFPKNFRSILRNKFLRLRLQDWWGKVWRILFYLIRISFGILLLLSIVLIFLTISIIVISLSASSDNDSGSSDSGYSNRGGGIIFMPHFWIGPDIFWFFDPGYNRPYRRQRTSPESSERSQMNFLEGIFSFLFGDGNPNADLEERRWQEIGTLIRNSRGAVVAEQIAPYLDDLGTGYQRDYEDYMLPVLSRFNGHPEVSPEGEIVYHFPDLQTTTQEEQLQPIEPYLLERRWRFSSAGSGQIMGAIGLGAINIVGALVLGSLLKGGEFAGFVGFVASIYWLLLGYGIGFLGIPLIRYFWIQWKNSKIEARNQKRQQEAIALSQADASLHKKIAYAQQFAAQNVINEENLIYTSERDLLDQELERKEQIDAEWQRRLESGS